MGDVDLDRLREQLAIDQRDPLGWAKSAGRALAAMPALIAEVERMRAQTERWASLACSACDGAGQVMVETGGMPESSDCHDCGATGSSLGAEVASLQDSERAADGEIERLRREVDRLRLDAEEARAFGDWR